MDPKTLWRTLKDLTMDEFNQECLKVQLTRPAAHYRFAGIAHGIPGAGRPGVYVSYLIWSCGLSPDGVRSEQV